MNLEASRNCLQCGQCTVACPTAALQTVSHVPRVLQAVQNHKVLLVQIDPSIQTLLSDYHYNCMEDLLQEMNVSTMKRNESSRRSAFVVYSTHKWVMISISIKSRKSFITSLPGSSHTPSRKERNPSHLLPPIVPPQRC